MSTAKQAMSRDKLWKAKNLWKNLVRSGRDELGYEPQLVNVRERVAKFEEEFNDLKPRFGTLETEVRGLKPRVDKLETHLQDMQTWTETTQKDVSELKTLQRRFDRNVEEMKIQSEKTKTEAEIMRKQFGREFGEVKEQAAAFEMAAKTRMDGLEDRARQRNEHVDGEIQRMKMGMVEAEKKLLKVQKKVDASRPVVVMINNFNVSDDNSSKMASELGSALRSALKPLETCSDDDDTQDHH